MTNDEKELQLNCKEQSQVTGKFKLKQEKILFCLLILIVLIIVLFNFFPLKKELLKAESADKNVNADFTLEQNLKTLAQLEKNTPTPVASIMQELPVMDKAPVIKRMHPPKLRHHVTPTNKEHLMRMNAPTSFFNSGINAVNNQELVSHKLMAGTSANDKFLNQQTTIATASAQFLPHPDFTIPAGEIIPATLETAINSDLPGMVRAISSRDIYALQGEKILIPKGAILIGQFSAAILQGQSRLLVVWSRLHLSNGLIVNLNSPGTDALGRAGNGASSIDNHFIQRFGASALLSILGAYAANAGVSSQDQYNSKAQYRMAVANSFQQAANQTLEQDMVIKPTLQINQGEKINVFVAQDLDFFYTQQGKK